MKPGALYLVKNQPPAPWESETRDSEERASGPDPHLFFFFDLNVPMFLFLTSPAGLYM